MPFDLENYFIFSPYFANTENISEKEFASLHEKAEKLSEETRGHLIGADTAEAIQNMIRLYNLSEKQAVILAVLVRRIYLKDANRSQLANDIVKYANISPQKAQELEEYLDKNIFSKTPEATSKTTTEAKPAGESVINLKNQ